MNSDSDSKHLRAATVGLALAFVVLRLLCANLWYFWEGDDAAIASGVAAVMRDSLGDTYRYAPQVGYYRLVQAGTELLGGEIARIPVVMVALSVAAGIAVPLLALGLFPLLTVARERRMLALLLATNPILWMSGEYGNSAVVSLALLVFALWLVSRARSSAGELLGLGVFAGAVLVRADAVLAGLALAWCVWDRHRAGLPWALRMGGLAALLAGVYGALLLFDPRMATFAEQVSSHLTTTGFRSHFFDYALWAFSPLPLVFAIWGVRALLSSNRRLLLFVALWCAPPFLFYFSTLTTPRYFLLSAVPISLCGAVGALELADALARRWRRVFATALVIGLASLHLVVPVDRLAPGGLRFVLQGAYEQTHDGPIYTGALLWQSLLRWGWLRRSWNNPGYGLDHDFPTHAERGLRALAADPGPPTRLFLVHRYFPGIAIHFHLHAVGATVTRPPSHPPDGEGSFAAPTGWQLGAHQVVTAQSSWMQRPDAAPLPLGASDLVWLDDARDLEVVRAQLAAGVSLEPTEGPGAPFLAYRVVASRR